MRIALCLGRSAVGHIRVFHASASNRLLYQFVRIVYDLAPDSAGACYKHAAVNPAISRVTGLEGEVQSHLELVGLDASIIAELLENGLWSRTRASRLEIDRCAIVGYQVVAGIEVRSLLVTMVADDLPVLQAEVNIQKCLLLVYMLSLPPPPGNISPRSFGPSNRPPLKMTVLRSPYGPSPMCLKVSMSHSKWKKNCSEGRGRVYSGFVHLVFVREEIAAGSSTVPGLSEDIVRLERMTKIIWISVALTDTQHSWSVYHAWQRPNAGHMQS